MNKYKYSPLPETGCLSESDSKRYFSVLGFGVTAMLIAVHGSSLLLAWLLPRLLPSFAALPFAGQLLSAVCIYGIGLPVLMLFLRRLPKDTPAPSSVGAVNFIGCLSVSVILLTVGSNVSSMLITLFEQISGRVLTNPVSSSMEATPLWADLLFVVILAPFFEELIFRKLLCDRLLPLGEGYAVVISAVIFGLIHGNFFQFFYAFLLGLLFSFLYVKTGRIRYSVVIHALINLVGGVLSPWMLRHLEPILEDPDYMGEILQMGMRGDLQALIAQLGDAALPFFALLIYENLFLAATVFGFIFLFRRRRQMGLCGGLLPPDREAPVASVFCNVGAASALTVFAAIFLLSLL